MATNLATSCPWSSRLEGHRAYRPARSSVWSLRSTSGRRSKLRGPTRWLSGTVTRNSRGRASTWARFPTMPSSSVALTSWEAPDVHQTTVRVAEGALDANQTIAQANRTDFDAAGVTVINLMSAPGAGKTTLLERVLGDLGDVRAGVLEGDVQGSLDAD